VETDPDPFEAYHRGGRASRVLKRVVLIGVGVIAAASVGIVGVSGLMSSSRAPAASPSTPPPPAALSEPEPQAVVVESQPQASPEVVAPAPPVPSVDEGQEPSATPTTLPEPVSPNKRYAFLASDGTPGVPESGGCFLESAGGEEDTLILTSATCTDRTSIVYDVTSLGDPATADDAATELVKDLCFPSENFYTTDAGTHYYRYQAWAPFRNPKPKTLWTNLSPGPTRTVAIRTDRHILCAVQPWPPT
jgi:hypothetical protein